ncbi:MAG: hypothetical protein ABSD44_11860 [Terracidiphilus sp.]
MSRLETLADQCRSERRFPDSPYIVHGQRPRKFGFHEPESITLREETVEPFIAKLSTLQSSKDAEERAMEEEIEAARYILEIENDTDADDFVPYSKTTLSCAIGFLRRQMIHAHTARLIGMGVPQIGPADRGSVDLFWEKADRTLLVNFPSSGGLVTYYGKKPKSEISGRFDPSEARTDLVIWLAE